MCLLSLQTSGVFNAEVHPDLPPAWTIAELLRYYLRRAKEAVLDANGNRGTSSSSGNGGGRRGRQAATTTGATTSSSSSEADGQFCQEGEERGSYLVRTVPVQISRKKVLIGCAIVEVSSEDGFGTEMIHEYSSRYSSNF